MKYNRLLKYQLLLITLVLKSVTFAQTTTTPQNYFMNILPLTPNAASLGKYGDVPVGNYTGVPEISIPLYDIVVKDLSVSISLGYHAGGIKVEEMASDVGLGWSLNSGGVISRQVRGKADELTDGFFDNATNGYSVNQLDGNSTTVSANSLAIIQNGIDTEPDQFSFSFGKYSGTFFFDQTSGKFYCNSDKEIRIQYIKSSALWQITVEDGTQYVFSEAETSGTTGDCVSAPNHAITSWYLTKIVSASQSQAINFTYQEASTEFQTLGTQTSYIYYQGDQSTGPPPQSCTQSNVNTSSAAKKISTITFPNGSIKFIYNNCRADLIGDQALNLIQIYQNNTLTKQYALNYSYFNNGYYSSTANYCDYSSAGFAANLSNSANLRLKLISVQAESGDGTQSSPPYSFTYNETQPLPSRLSYAQDYWGYYNGQANNSLIPTFSFTNPSTGALETITGANRNPGSSYSQIGILQSITYPTGGQTTFEYENNRVQTAPGLPPATITRAVSVGMADLSQNNGIGQFNFTINNANSTGAYATYTYNYQGNCNNLYPNCVQIYIFDSNNNKVLTFQDNATGSNPVLLPNGVYTLKYHMTGGATATSFSAQMQWQEADLTNINNVMVGGLRVTHIRDQTAQGIASDRYYTYYSDDTNTQSSGNILTLPTYNYLMEYNVPYYGDLQNPQTVTGVLTSYWNVLNSFTNYPLATSQGSHACYSRVTETQGNTQGPNGKTVYQYSWAPDYTEGQGTGFPFAPLPTSEPLRGLPTDETVYAYLNGAFTPIKETINSYNYTGAASYSVLTTSGIKIGKKDIIYNGGPTTGLLYQVYATPCDWIYLTSTTNRTYDPADATKHTDIITNYTYDPNTLQTTQLNTLNSKGEQLITQMQYPGSYTDANAGTVIGDMKNNRFIQNALVQKTMSKIDNQGNNKLLASEITQYNYTPGTGTNYIEPVEKDILETTQVIDPTNTTAFPPYEPANGYNTTLFKKRVSYSYDGNGVITQQQLTGGPPVSYQWGYNEQYPVAQVSNASSNDIFYDSFEEGDGKSAIGIAKTGHYSYSGTYTHTFSGLDPGTYILSYWLRSPTLGTWSLVSTTVSAGATYTIPSITGQIDDVRFYPASAQMTTYTYDPLIGMTSSTDAKNETTYYEYDNFQRLMNIKDKDGNIVKHTEYHYQGQ